jgi:hypothetical protein
MSPRAVDVVFFQASQGVPLGEILLVFSSLAGFMSLIAMRCHRVHPAEGSSTASNLTVLVIGWHR